MCFCLSYKYGITSIQLPWLIRHLTNQIWGPLPPFKLNVRSLINLCLDNNIIPECKTLKHVGIILENGFNSTERTITACRLIRSLSMSIIKQGIHPPVMNPTFCSKIILQLCYTKALYGCELWNNLTNNEILLLERAHRYVCKYVQGLPKLTRTDKCTTLLGWTSIGCYIDSKKLLFLDKLCNMPSRFLPKQNIHYTSIIILEQLYNH
jgi:hypothetical protein